MAGICFAHTENSLPDPFLAAPLLHLLLCGIKRTLGLTSRQRLPITIGAAGRVGPPPHLSLFTPGWGCAPLVASSVTVQGVSLPPSLPCSLPGCVAATLIPLCILLGCVAATLIACTLWGVLLPPLFYPRVHPTTFSPIYCQRLCILS